jgi:predicted house-cleaning noncanonical NTP pyrophosphatase (MazG superfamily)
MMHNKLVRDRVPERLKEKGVICFARELDAYEYIWELTNKLAEETDEVRMAIKTEDSAIILGELADAQAVIDHLKYALGFSTQELNDAVSEKQRTHGGFSRNRLLLIETLSPEEPEAPKGARGARDSTDRGTPARSRVFEVWMEGFQVTGQSAGASLLGTVEAVSFEEACRLLCTGRHDYSPVHNTVWGCRLFRTRAEAAANFG